MIFCGACICRCRGWNDRHLQPVALRGCAGSAVHKLITEDTVRERLDDINQFEEMLQTTTWRS